MLAILTLLLPAAASAHGVTGSDAQFLQGIDGAAIGPFLYLGAKHMVTGYDHLLFLVGVIFFLYRLKDVLLYVSLFTIGHSLTLLVGVLESFSSFWASAYKEVIVFTLIIPVLVWRSFSTHHVDEEE